MMSQTIKSYQNLRLIGINIINHKNTKMMTISLKSQDNLKILILKLPKNKRFMFN